MSATASFLERLRGEGEDREVDPYERVRGGIKWASGRLRGGVNEAIEWVWLKATGRPRGGGGGGGASEMLNWRDYCTNSSSCSSAQQYV